MQYIRSDQYTHVAQDCPVNVDMHPVDGVVEITIGECRFGGDALRLIVGHPDVCLRLTDALRDAQARLVGHLRAQASHDPAMSQLER